MGLKSFYFVVKWLYPIITAGLPKMLGLQINWLTDAETFIVVLICQIWFVHCASEFFSSCNKESKK